MARRAKLRTRKATANRCRPRFEQLESRQLLAASPWHNSFLPPDVDANGTIAPIDALLIVNELNANGPRQLVQGEGEIPMTGSDTKVRDAELVALVTDRLQPTSGDR